MHDGKAVTVRPAAGPDHAEMIALWNQCADAGEVVYSPISQETFQARLMQPGSILLVARAGGKLAGWLHAAADDGDTGYLTAVFVAPALRRRGIATQLLLALETRMRALGKQMLACSGNNPVHLDWRVPGTPGHDHNNAPGVDEDCAGYPFLLASGWQPRFQAVAMYMPLSAYRWPDEMNEIRRKLEAESIYVGPYDGKASLSYDGMCDRVGSDYWRNVLRRELEAWQTGKPCADESLWADGVPPRGPRPLLMAIAGDRIVGFTGPVDKQRSGRGWFTGICVDPLYGKRSIGTLLFHLLMQAFIDEGAAFTTLFTGAENHAQRIYQNAGLSAVRHFAAMAKPLVDGAVYDQTHF